MKIKCPNCGGKTKAKNIRALRFEEHFTCRLCKSHIYLDGSPFWGHLISDILSGGLGYVVVLAVFLIMGAFLPSSMGGAGKIITALISAIVIGYLYLKCVAFIYIARLKLKC